MDRSKMSWLAVSFSVAVLGGLLGKWAIDHYLPWQNASANETAKIDLTQKALEPHWRSKITFQAALQTAEAAIGGKAYSIERETEGGKSVIEVGIDGREVFVDAESGKIALIENLRQKGDREDIAKITEALKLQKLATVPIQTAMQTAESFAGQQVHSVDLENKHGSLVYEAAIGMQEVFIDAGDGKVLATGTVGQADEDDAQINSSIQIPFTNDQ
jgi:uncharacterized membrane protein YkoI